MPRRASCHAASVPARPPPITVIRECKFYSKFVARALLPAAPTLMSALVLEDKVVHWVTPVVGTLMSALVPGDEISPDVKGRSRSCTHRVSKGPAGEPPSSSRPSGSRRPEPALPPLPRAAYRRAEAHWPWR